MGNLFIGNIAFVFPYLFSVPVELLEQPGLPAEGRPHAGQRGMADQVAVGHQFRIKAAVVAFPLIDHGAVHIHQIGGAGLLRRYQRVAVNVSGALCSSPSGPLNSSYACALPARASAAMPAATAFVKRFMFLPAYWILQTTGAGNTHVPSPCAIVKGQERCQDEQKRRKGSRPPAVSLSVSGTERPGYGYLFTGRVTTHGSSNCTTGRLSSVVLKLGIFPLSSGSMINAFGSTGAVTGVSTGFFNCGTHSYGTA